MNLNSNEFEFKLLYNQTKENHAPAWMQQQDFKLRQNFNYLWWKIRLNARLSKLNPRKLNKAN